MNLFETHVFLHRAAHIRNARFKEHLHRVHACLSILDHRQIVDLNVLVTVNVHIIWLV